MIKLLQQSTSPSLCSAMRRTMNAMAVLEDQNAALKQGPTENHLKKLLWNIEILQYINLNSLDPVK